MKRPILSLAGIALILLAVCLFASGCTSEGVGPGGNGAVKEEYVLISTPYDTELSSANVLRLVFERAGYDLEIRIADVGLAFQGLAQGSGDFFVGAWMPTCHGSYAEAVDGKIDFVRINLNGTRCGLVVPSYVTIDSIEDLNGEKDKFDGQIVGIEPGAGIMKGTDQAIEDYGLELEVMAGSEAGMVAALVDAIDDGDWIVVTGWSPHWKFVRWDMKYLDDPLNVYGGEEYISTYTRSGFADEEPEAYAILERFTWEPSDMESIMLDMQEGMTEEEAAAKWVDAHPEKVDEWLGTA